MTEPSPLSQKAREAIEKEVKGMTDFEIQEYCNEALENPQPDLPPADYVKSQEIFVERVARRREGNYNPTPPQPEA